MLKVAIIGLGNIGNTHAGVYQDSDRAQLVAVCDLDKGLAAAASERYGVPAFHSVAELVEGAELDAVSVTTAGPENGGHHYEPVMECLEAGLHVLCEKPISNDIELARKMVAKADETGLYFGNQFESSLRAAGCQSQAVGAGGQAGRIAADEHDDVDWQPQRHFGPGFTYGHSTRTALISCAIFCGDVRRVQAFFNQAPGRVCYSNAQVNLEFENGVVGHLTGSYDTNPRHNLERCEVMGTEGRLVLDNLYQELTPLPSPQRRVNRNSQQHHGRAQRLCRYILQPHQPLDRAGGRRRAAGGDRRLRS